MNIPYKVSVCVPVYGVEKYIARCATSLLEQTYPNIEYLFVNDCTKDASIEVLRNTIALYPARADRVRIINHDHNRGLAAARNTLVEEATGEFILHVDSDDYVDTDVVEKLVDRQMETGADIVNYDMKIYNPNYEVTIKAASFSSPQALTKELLKRNVPVCVWGGLVCRSLYIDHNIKVKEGINMSEDYQVTPRLAYFAEKVAALHGAYYHYDNTNSASYCNVFSEKQCRQTWETLDLLSTFFSNKGNGYQNALDEGKVKVFLDNKINACHAGNEAFFHESSRRLDSLDRTCYRCVSLPYRLAIRIHNYQISRFYVSVMKAVKHRLGIR